ncbi:MAG: hypothetical protein AB8B92_02140, partial [Gammaproteobacteria bacterium]
MVAAANPVALPRNIAASLLDVGTLPFAVALLRANDGSVVFVNHLMSVILRSSEGELKGKTITGLYDDGKQRSEAFKLLKKSTYVPPKQITITNFDNNALTVTAASSLLKYQNELCILVALQPPSPDTTNVKRLRIAIERHNMALQAAQVGIWSWDLMSNRIAWDDT